MTTKKATKKDETPRRRQCTGIPCYDRGRDTIRHISKDDCSDCAWGAPCCPDHDMCESDG